MFLSFIKEKNGKNVVFYLLYLIKLDIRLLFMIQLSWALNRASEGFFPQQTINYDEQKAFILHFVQRVQHLTSEKGGYFFFADKESAS